MIHTDSLLDRFKSSDIDGIAENMADKFRTSRNCAAEKDKRRMNFLVFDTDEIGPVDTSSVIAFGVGESLSMTVGEGEGTREVSAEDIHFWWRELEEDELGGD